MGRSTQVENYRRAYRQDIAKAEASSDPCSSSSLLAEDWREVFDFSSKIKEYSNISGGKKELLK